MEKKKKRHREVLRLTKTIQEEEEEWSGEVEKH